eukprot:512771_1
MALQYTNSDHAVETLESKLTLLSDVYHEVMLRRNRLQPRRDFFGARDFYSIVRHFLTSLDQENKTIDELEELIVYFLRNFGGIDYDRIDGGFNKNPKARGSSLFHIMVKHMALNDDQRILDVIGEYSPSKLVELNLNDRRSTHDSQNSLSCDNYIISRHIMVITEHTNSWNVLMDLNVINHDNVFIFGSEFERDSSNMYLYLNRVQNCMETGQTLILIHLEDIHESLYDMLNQRYVFRKTDNKMYCRIALGSNSQTCFVDPKFKCIVITSKDSAHSEKGTPIAFLNRFEKQLVSYYNSLRFDQFKLLYALQIELYSLYQCHDETHFPDMFPGYCRDTLPSIVINVYNYFDKYREHGVIDIDLKQDKHILINECIKILCHLNSTESLVRAASSKRFKDISFDTVCTLKGIIQMDDIYIYDELIVHNPT